jgi:hypothetical protein
MKEFADAGIRYVASVVGNNSGNLKKSHAVFEPM